MDTTTIIKEINYLAEKTKNLKMAQILTDTMNEISKIKNNEPKNVNDFIIVNTINKLSNNSENIKVSEVLIETLNKIAQNNSEYNEGLNFVKSRLLEENLYSPQEINNMSDLELFEHYNMINRHEYEMQNNDLDNLMNAPEIEKVKNNGIKVVERKKTEMNQFNNLFN